MEALVYWVAAREPEVHFLDAILSAYDGLANVRRDYRLMNGMAYYRVYVSPGMESEFLEIVERLRRDGAILDVARNDQTDASPASSDDGADAPRS